MPADFAFEVKRHYQMLSEGQTDTVIAAVAVLLADFLAARSQAIPTNEAISRETGEESNPPRSQLQGESAFIPEMPCSVRATDHGSHVDR